MWGIFYIILTVPQITLMDLNNVMQKGDETNKKFFIN